MLHLVDLCALESALLKNTIETHFTCLSGFSVDCLKMDSLNTTTAIAPALTSAASAAATDIPTTAALSSAMTRASDVVVAHGSSSWIGLIARLILWILQLLSTIIYFALKLTTISIPTLLFNLFSTSLTVTMNATTV